MGSLPLAAALLAWLLLGGASAAGTAFHWTGENNDNRWDQRANWSPSHAWPGQASSADTAVLEVQPNRSTTVLVYPIPSVSQLALAAVTLGPGMTIIVLTQDWSAAALNVSGNLTVNGGHNSVITRHATFVAGVLEFQSGGLLGKWEFDSNSTINFSTTTDHDLLGATLRGTAAAQVTNPTVVRFSEGSTLQCASLRVVVGASLQCFNGGIQANCSGTEGITAGSLLVPMTNVTGVAAQASFSVPVTAGVADVGAGALLVMGFPGAVSNARVAEGAELRIAYVGVASTPPQSNQATSVTTITASGTVTVGNPINFAGKVNVSHLRVLPQLQTITFAASAYIGKLNMSQSCLAPALNTLLTVQYLNVGDNCFFGRLDGQTGTIFAQQLVAHGTPVYLFPNTNFTVGAGTVSAGNALWSMYHNATLRVATGGELRIAQPLMIQQDIGTVQRPVLQNEGTVFVQADTALETINVAGGGRWNVERSLKLVRSVFTTGLLMLVKKGSLFSGYTAALAIDSAAATAPGRLRFAIRDMEVVCDMACALHTNATLESSGSFHCTYVPGKNRGALRMVP
eukprot:TRINITY_DN8987_c0_g1_i1.p1 TRINITY_DN8987_c0_g1~~TRINITY_DN8987_c0_g1_i1.p1  ORF type:complete len:570 (+),score=123.25 TRINITY_DN8987_c0_g1_i1:69-1778(+)